MGGKGRAYVGRQRQLSRFSALSPNGNLASAPVKIVQAQPNDFAGAYAEPGEQQQDGMVPPAKGRFSIAAFQNTFPRGGRQKSRKRGKRPIGDSGDPASKIGSDFSEVTQIAEERPKRRYHEPGPHRTQLTRVTHHESGDVRRA